MIVDRKDLLYRFPLVAYHLMFNHFLISFIGTSGSFFIAQFYLEIIIIVIVYVVKCMFTFVGMMPLQPENAPMRANSELVPLRGCIMPRSVVLPASFSPASANFQSQQDRDWGKGAVQEGQFRDGNPVTPAGNREGKPKSPSRIRDGRPAIAAGSKEDEALISPSEMEARPAFQGEDRPENHLREDFPLEGFFAVPDCPRQCETPTPAENQEMEIQIAGRQANSIEGWQNSWARARQQHNKTKKVEKEDSKWRNKENDKSKKEAAARDWALVGQPVSGKTGITFSPRPAGGSDSWS